MADVAGGVDGDPKGCIASAAGSATTPAPWHAVRVTDPATEWLTVPDLVDRMGLPQGRVRRLLEERVLLGIRRDGVLSVPADFLVGSEPLRELRGTLVVLADSGYSDEEAMEWMLAPEPSIGDAPIAALRAGRKAEVRRVAQSLAF